MGNLSTKETTDKNGIATGFGQAVAYYDEYANVQREVAERLIASLKPWRNILPPGPILEIGCGTGFVTKGLIELYPGRELHITDISEEMVAFCENRFGGCSNTRFRELDAETLSVEKPVYSMVVSGFAAQWFEDPAQTLGRCLEAIQPGGLLLTSFPGNQSFPEWKEHCRELGIPFTGNELPDTEEMVVKLSMGPVQVDYYEDTISQRFSRAFDFFRHIKQIGAGVQKEGRPLTASEMRLLLNHWDAQAEGDIEVSYHGVFIAAKRDYE